MIRRKIKGYEIELKMQEFLYYIAAPFLGYPAQLNRWVYPDILDWDWNEESENWDIPARIAFYTDPQRYTPLQTWQQFSSQINRALANLGGHYYRIDRPPGEHFIWVVRRHINYRWNYYVEHDNEAPIHEVSRWYSTLEWEEQKREWIREFAADPERNGKAPEAVLENLRTLRPNFYESAGF
jgi:hypothetical protein